MFGIFKRVAELEERIEILSMDIGYLEMTLLRITDEDWKPLTKATPKKKRGRPRKAK